MPDLIPVALVGLAIAIAIYFWWLHRQAKRDNLQVVPSIDLWEGSPSHCVGNTSRWLRDWWILRTALCLCVLAALAELSWPHGTRTEIVWVDATPSLETREANGDRVDLAAAAISDTLQKAGAETIRLFALQDAAISTDTLDISPDRIAHGLRSLLARTERGSTSRIPEGARWIFSDGSSAHLGPLAGKTSARVISAGVETENVGVTALSARISLLDPDTLIVLAELRNSGLEQTSRTLTLSRETQGSQSTEITLSPGSTEWIQFKMPVEGIRSLTAVLSPTDALKSDDELILPIRESGLVTEIRLAPTCSPRFQDAVSAMRGFRLADGIADIAIDCGPNPDPTAALRFWTGTGTAVTSPVSWTNAASEDLQRVPVSSMKLAASLPVLSSERGLPILLGGQQVLATTGPTGLDVYVDLTPAAVQEDAWFPILFRELIAQASSGDATKFHRVSRAHELVSVAPTEPARPAAQLTVPLRKQQDLTWIFILVAVVLLLADTIRVRRHDTQ